jgi:ribose 5-phosphate isomerase A
MKRPSQPTSATHQLPTSVPLPALPAIEQAKKLAAFAAVDRHVLPTHTVIGIGSGSTVPYVVERIMQQGADVNSRRVFIPTGTYSPTDGLFRACTCQSVTDFTQVSSPKN